MATLVISLEAGFSNDSCSIAIDRKKPLLHEGLKTDYSIGLAKKTEHEVKKGRHKVKIDVTSRKLNQTIWVDVSETTYLHIWIDEGGNLSYQTTYELPTLL